MSISPNRFGRRTARQSDDPRTEPVLSFSPKRPAARDAQSEPAPAVSRKPQSGLRIDREDAKTFGISFGEEDGPSIERQDEFDPHSRRDKALDQRVPEADRPLYHHLFDEQDKRGRGLGWIAALGSVAVVAIGAGYAWHNFMARPAPGNLLAPPGYASRGNTGYTTPQQPATDAAPGADAGSAGSTASSLAATPPATTDQPPTKDIAAVPEPKSLPAEPPPPPRKTISEAAANPGSLGPAANPSPPPAQPTAKTQPAAAPAPVLTPPAPKHDAPKPDASKPRKEASITPPKPAPVPTRQNAAPPEATPPAISQPAAAPAVAPPPRASRRAQATDQPQQLTRDAPATYTPAPQQRQAQQQQQPDNLGPPPAAPDSVTVDGVNYVNGQEPHSLGTVGGAPQTASADSGMPPSAAPMPQQSPTSPTARPYMPTDHDGGAPLPNDVIILPSGQMAVPDSQR